MARRSTAGPSLAGLFPRALSRALHLAFDRRQQYDYGERVQLSQQVTQETLADARAFVMSIEAHLRGSGYLVDAQQEGE